LGITTDRSEDAYTSYERFYLILSFSCKAIVFLLCFVRLVGWLDPLRIQLFGILSFGHCDLPFDLAQGGELVEPFGICVLLFEI